MPSGVVEDPAVAEVQHRPITPRATLRQPEPHRKFEDTRELHPTSIQRRIAYVAPSERAAAHTRSNTAMNFPRSLTARPPSG